MAWKKSKRQETLELRRSRILCAARRVFARQPFDQTAVDHIAEEAGLAKGTLYLSFDSKEEIYMAALLEDARALNETTRGRMQGAESWSEAIRAFMTVRLEYLESHQDFLRIYLAEFRGRIFRRAKMSCELYQVMREGEHQLASALSAAMAVGEVRQVDPSMVAQTVADMTRGLMERRLLGISNTAGSADLEFTLDLLCRSLLPTGHEARC